MERTRLVWPVVAVCCFIITVVIVWWCWVQEPTTVIVVRHAERADASANTNLSTAGVNRADELALAVADVSLDAVYSTEFCRTAQTAQPTAIAEGLPIRIPASSLTGSDIGNCTPAITVATTPLAASLNASDALAAYVLSEHRGEGVLIVGHSNTVPEVVAALLPPAFSAVSVGSNEFDHLFVVVIPRFFGVARLVKARYPG